MESILNVFEKVISMSIEASITVAFVLVARVLFKVIMAPKKYAYIIWIIPFIRLICPFIMESPLSVMPKDISVYENQEDEPVNNQNLNQLSESDNNNLSTNPIYGYDMPDSNYPVPHSILQEDSIIENPIIEENGTEKSKVGIKEVLAIVWLTGILGIFVYSTATLLRFKKRLVGSVMISEDVYGCDYIETAFVIGVVKPRIYVPSHISDAEMKYVVSHERFHIKRFDYVMKPIAYFIAMAHWFNPIVWFSYMLMERDMEMSCDEAVLGELGLESKTDYAKALLKLSAGRRFVPSMPTAFAEGETKGRVKNIMKIKKPLIIVAVVAVLAVSVLGVVLLTNPKDDSKEEEQKSSDVIKEMPEGKYYMQVEKETAGVGNIDKFIPVLSINEDGSISFAYDPFSSYYNISLDGYIIEGDTLSFTTDDGIRKFSFIIAGNDRLIFDAKNSFDMRIADEGVAYPVTDEAEFVLSSEDGDTQIGMSQDNELIYYGSIGEVSYQQANITEDMTLGADGVILDYVSDGMVIFHGYAGLFVYDLDNFRMIASVDTSHIEYGSATYKLDTQGDNAYTFSVSPDGNYVYMLPVGMDAEITSFIIEGSEETGQKYAGPFAFSYEVETEKLYACAPDLLMDLDRFEGKLETVDCISGIGESEGFYSNSCVQVSEGVYGYLHCSTGLWKDICYVESDMVYMLYGETTDNVSSLVEDYPYGEEIYIENPNISKTNGLGGEGAILDYVDDNVIIFHGQYGLFVYDRNYQMISDAFDLYSLDCHYTRGDAACLVEVGNDYRIYLTPGNQDNAYIYDINENKMLKVSKTDILDVDKERATLVSNEYIMIDHTSFQSYNCVKGNKDGKAYYGYLLSGSGLWYDLFYVEDYGGEHGTVALLSDYLDGMEE